MFQYEYSVGTDISVPMILSARIFSKIKYSVSKGYSIPCWRLGLRGQSRRLRAPLARPKEGRQAGRKEGRQEGRHAVPDENVEARKAGRKEGRKAGRQAGRQAGMYFHFCTQNQIIEFKQFKYVKFRHVEVRARTTQPPTLP